MTRDEILPVREQAAIRNRWLIERLDRVVPAVMERSAIDAWVLVAREYNEDPVVETMLPAEWLSARRRTILVFLDRGARRLAVSRYPVGDAFPSAWDPAGGEDQWRRLAGVLAEAHPESIALNTSAEYALADGLSATEHSRLVAALEEPVRNRLVDGTGLSVGWLEARIDEEMAWYPKVCAIAHSILRDGLSPAAISPGATTTSELEWWYRQRVTDMGLRCWFHPAVTVQRHGAAPRTSFADHAAEKTIRRGDLVHVDFGIEYLGLHTDMQEHAYVLRPGEAAAPAGMVHGLAAANRLQDILTAEFAVGRTGNDVLAAARSKALDEGIVPAIYTHPIGVHGHAAGPTIGMWDQQDGVPGAGDYPLFPSTAYSIELNATVSVPEWGGQEVAFMVEQDAFFDGDRVEYLDGRQTELWLV